MSLWIVIAIVAYLLFALSAVADKFLLSHVERHPAVYAFFIGITGPLSFVLAPFGLEWIGWSNLFIALISGMCFTVALFFLYTATQQTSVSRILPIEGGMVPLFTLVFAYALLGERLSMMQNIAFIFLVFGAVLISLRHDDYGWHLPALKNAIYAALLFAMSFTLTKYIFTESNFISGMIWTRLGFFITALSFLLNPQVRRQIFNAPKKAKAKNILLYYSSRASGTIAGFMQNYAISLGSVTIVNALQGVQFTFLLVVTTFLSLTYPSIIKERVTRGILTLKIIAIAFITVGLVILST